jgi:hypothetical protein
MQRLEFKDFDILSMSANGDKALYVAAITTAMVLFAWYFRRAQEKPLVDILIVS